MPSVSPTKGAGKRPSIAIHTPRATSPSTGAPGTPGGGNSPEKTNGGTGGNAERIQLTDVGKYITGDGITLMELMRMFAHRVGRPGGTSKADFFAMLKTNFAFGDDKKLRPRRQATSAAASGGGEGAAGEGASPTHAD